MNQTEGKWYVYGLDAATGEPLHPPVGPAEIAAALDPKHEPSDAEHELGEQERRKREGKLAIAGDADPQDLAKVGWAVVFAHDADPRVVAALEPLVEHRRAEAGDLCKVFSGANGVGIAEKASAFRARFQVSGMVDPAKIPYHVLLVGDPLAIPFEFERSFAVQYSVGRIHFEHPDDYARYAQAVIAHESALPADAPLRFFATAHPGDEATQSSRAQLADPLVAHYRAAGVALDASLGPDATKAALHRLLESGRGPQFVVTATHGLGFNPGDANQLAMQGGLVCGDWPGKGPIGPDYVFGARDLDANADLTGTLAFIFGCYTAGTPKFDRYWLLTGGERPGMHAQQIAPAPFTARLAREMLGRAKPALAVIGHIEKAWTTSYAWPGVADATSAFRGFIDGVRAGGRLGHALHGFIDAASQYRQDWEQLRDDRLVGIPNTDQEYAWTWLASRDGSAYSIFGDPALRFVARRRA